MVYAAKPPDVTRELGARLLNLVLPAPCLGCGRVSMVKGGSFGLCLPCHTRLVRWPETSCTVCGSLAGTGGLPRHYRCGRCLDEAPPFDRLWSAWSYQPPLDAALTSLKFRRLDYLGARLGRAIVPMLLPLLKNQEVFPDVVVPVPLHPLRLLRRGYNQAALIARPIAEALDCPLRRLLFRWRSTPAQSTLGRDARRHNLRRAFVAFLPDRCRGRRVLLVDDVVTTGSTLRAAALCLRRAGALSVVAVTVARTPKDHERELLRRPPHDSKVS